jgi:hypothetical protein
MGTVIHVCVLSIQEAETEMILSLRPAWIIQKDPVLKIRGRRRGQLGGRHKLLTYWPEKERNTQGLGKRTLILG